MAIKFRGETYGELDFAKITPAEVSAIEKQVRMSWPKIKRAMQTCVCEHGKQAHERKDDQGELTDVTSCTSCACEELEPDIPSEVSTAMLWVSVKRHVPTVTFREVADTPYADLAADDEPAEEPENPT
jgi:hypothetical protein